MGHRRFSGGVGGRMGRLERLGSGTALSALVAAAMLGGMIGTRAARGQDGQGVYKHYLEIDAKLESELPDYRKLRDADVRAKVKEKALPVLRDLNGVLAEIVKFQEIGGLAQWRGVEVRALQIVLEDAEAVTAQEAGLKSEDGNEKLLADCTKVALEYFAAKADDVREKKVAEFAALAEKYPERHEPTGLAAFMLGVTESEKIEDELLDIVRKKLSSTSAGYVAIKYEGPRKMRNALGKPLTFRYQTLDGKPVQASDYAGKVLIVHFFATTNEKSMKEVNKMARVYLTNRSKGVELVGVSCDLQKTDLTLWLEAFKRATWPILFDPFSAQQSKTWHPLTLQVGISKLPATLLIDRKGVLRYANPENFEAKLKELVEEK